MVQYVITSEDIHKRKDNDAYFRLNYLYQASLLFQQSNIEYAQFMKEQMQKVAEKVPIRMTPQIKHTHCKKCLCPIVFGEVKFKKICKKLFIVKTCLKCKFQRKIFVKKLKDFELLQKQI
ncbi:unnamed protein product [Paramecium pentaurelia]|uniref:Uncharacterized protein n=1 Tax=Paramecium pentaurelia TaxID=43138 RepID=A0A8S1UFD5_9CILI|nr:unnamed protein product [Paramecium pentaurelia]